MSATVDERIVAAKFDASDFEKGVNKTIKKLDELKKSLDMKDAAKSVKELAEKTEVSTNSMSNSLDKLTNRLTTFTGMIKQNILGGLAEQVSNVFLSMERSVTGFIKSISSDQVSVGMSKYEQMLASVRVMTSAGESQEDAYKALERIQEYTDQTSYSMTQMTDAMSKMVAAGVDLETAEKNVEGIANACANAGINATDASRAFYNLSQAYSKGYLEYTDYRSLELMNLTTKDFKTQMLEAAAAAETLEKKVDKTGKTIYRTTNKKDKKVKAGKIVNQNNLSDMLKTDFMNTEAMNKLFGSAYWMEVIDKDEISRLRKELGDEEFEKRFGKIATMAYQAAYEARSFTDVINTLKDAVSTGWSETFQHLFGKLEEAKDFFTGLTEGPLAKVIYKIGEYRNAVLGYWNSTDALGRGTGGVAFRQSILKITEALGILLQTIQQILPGFNELDKDGQPVLKTLGENLKVSTMRFRDFTRSLVDSANKFQAWMNSPLFNGDKGTTRIEAIRSAIANLATVFSIIGKVVSIAFKAIVRAIGILGPVFDGFISLLNKITEPLSDLSEDTAVFDSIRDSVNNLLDVLTPVSEALGKVLEFLGEIGKFIAQFAIDTAISNLTFFADIIRLITEVLFGKSQQSSVENGTTILEGLRIELEKIKAVCETGLGAIQEFFGAIISDLRELFGLSNKEGKEVESEGGIFSRVFEFFDNNQFIKDAEVWITEAIENVKKWFIALPGRIIEGVGKIGNWIDEVFNFLMSGKGSETKTGSEESKKISEDGTKEITSRFDQFITDTKNAITNWFNDLPNKVRKALKSTGSFISQLYSKLDDFLFGKKITGTRYTFDEKTNKVQRSAVTNRIKTGFSKWLDGVIAEVKKFIANIPDYIKKGIKGAGDIVNAIITSVFGTQDERDVKEKVESGLEKPFLNIDFTKVFNAIKEIGREILNQIGRIFTGSEDFKINADFFARSVAEGIRWIREKATIAFAWVLEFISTLPSRIASIFSNKSKTDSATGSSPVKKAIDEFAVAVGNFILGIPSAIASFFSSAIAEFDKLWDDLYNSIIGKNSSANNLTDGTVFDPEVKKDLEETASKEVDGINDNIINDTEAGEKSKWEQFIERLGSVISQAFEKLPKWIAQGIEIATLEINKLIAAATDWLHQENIAGEIQQAAAESAEGKQNANEDSDLLKSIKSIGGAIYSMITTTIPAFITEAFAFITKKGNDVWNTITTMFDGIDKESFRATITSLGEKIKSAINDLPGIIQSAFKSVSTFVKSLFRTENSGLFDEDAFTLDPKTGKPITEKVKKDVKKIDDNLTKQTGEGHKWTFIETIKESLLSAFESIGPAILNGLSKALDFISNIVEIVIDALTGEKTIGEQITEVYGKESPKMKAALTNIGESIKKFFMDTVPRLIGSAIGFVTANAPDWFDKLFGAMDQAKTTAEKEADKEAKSAGSTDGAKKATESARGILDIVGDFIDAVGKIATDKVVGAVAIVVGIVLIIRSLHDLFSISDELDSAAGVLKWGAITIAVAGLVGFLSSITNLVESGDPQKVEDAKMLLDKLSGLFEKIKWIVGILAASKIVPSLLNLFPNKNKDKDFGDIAKTGFFAKIGNFLTDAIGGFLKTAGIVGGAGVAADLASSGISHTVDSITGTLMDFTSEIADILQLFDPMIDQLVGLDDKLVTATEAVKKIGNLFGEFYKTFTGMYINASGKLPDGVNPMNDNTYNTHGKDSIEVSAEQFMEEIQEGVNVYTQLTTFIEKFAGSIKVIGEIPHFQKKLENLTEVITSDEFKNFLYHMFESLAIAFNQDLTISSQFNKFNESMFRGMGAALEVLSNGLSMFNGSLNGLTEENVASFDQALGVFMKLAESLNGTEVNQSYLKDVLSGKNKLSDIGSQFSLFSNYMKTFVRNVTEIPGFEDGTLTRKTKSQIEAVLDIAESMSKAASTVAMGNEEAFLNLTEVLPRVGENLASFSVNMATGLNNELLKSSKDKIESIAAITHAVSELIYSFGAWSRGSDFVEFGTIAESIQQGLEGKSGEQLTQTLTDLVDKVASVVTRTDSLEKIKASGSIIAKSLFEGIQTALDTDTSLQLKITPVINMDKLNEQFLGDYNLDFTALVAAVSGANSSKDAQIIDYSAKLDSINTSIDAIASSTATSGDVTSALSGIKVWLDGNILVGAIADRMDRAIGEKIWLITRNNAVSQ